MAELGCVEERNPWSVCEAMQRRWNVGCVQRVDIPTLMEIQIRASRSDSSNISNNDNYCYYGSVDNINDENKE